MHELSYVLLGRFSLLKKVARWGRLKESINSFNFQMPGHQHDHQHIYPLNSDIQPSLIILKERGNYIKSFYIGKYIISKQHCQNVINSDMPPDIYDI
jgi:hypothetical protein